MIKLFLLVVIILFSVHSEQARAGTHVGHGGGAWVCRENGTSAITWAKLVDLFEATHQYGLVLDSFTGVPAVQDSELTSDSVVDEPSSQIAAQIATKIQAVNPGVFSVYSTDLAGIRAGLLMSPNILIPADGDADFQVEPAVGMCPGGQIGYEQVADYPTGDNLVISSSLYAKLSPVDQAALFVHEAVYKMYRDAFQATDSDLAREAVAYLFSTTAPSQYPFYFFGSPTLLNTVLKNVVSTAWAKDPVTQANFPVETFFDSLGYSAGFSYTTGDDNGWTDADPADSGVISLAAAVAAGSPILNLTARWTDSSAKEVILVQMTYQCQAPQSDLEILRYSTTTIYCTIKTNQITGPFGETYNAPEMNPNESNQYLMITFDSGTLIPQILLVNGEAIEPALSISQDREFMPASLLHE